MTTIKLDPARIAEFRRELLTRVEDYIEVAASKTSREIGSRGYEALNALGHAVALLVARKGKVNQIALGFFIQGLVEALDGLSGKKLNVIIQDASVPLNEPLRGTIQ